MSLVTQISHSILTADKMKSSQLRISLKGPTWKILNQSWMMFGLGCTVDNFEHTFLLLVNQISDEDGPAEIR